MKRTINLPKTNTIEENAEIWAEFHNEFMEHGHGLFLYFEATPELEKPCIDYMVKHFGYVLEKPYFIRKPKI